jgi:membrane protease YdiL (CAAX protease family)
MLAVEFVLELGFFVLIKGVPGFRSFLHSHTTSFFNARGVVLFSAYFALAAVLLQACSVGDFVRRFLPAPKDLLAPIIALCGGVVIGLINLHGAEVGVTAGHSMVSRVLSSGASGALIMLLSSTILAPLAEEAVLSAVVYRGLRAKLDPFLSTIVVVNFTAFLHLGTFRRSMSSAVCLTAITVLLCIFMEKSGLWSCVVCHAAYNATVLRFLWGLIGIVIIVAATTLWNLRRSGGSREPLTAPKTGSQQKEPIP